MSDQFISAMNDGKREIRNKRHSDFINNILPELKKYCNVEIITNGFKIYTVRYGAIKYYPKANNIYFENKTSLKKYGLNFIKKNILDTKNN